MEELKVIKNTSIGDQGQISIAKFLSGKNIFITGATGFLGQCLIERLLSASPSIGKIYILIRGKHGFSAETRVTKLLSKAVSPDEKKNFIRLFFIRKRATCFFGRFFHLSTKKMLAMA